MRSVVGSGRLQASIKSRARSHARLQSIRGVYTQASVGGPWRASHPGFWRLLLCDALAPPCGSCVNYMDAFLDMSTRHPPFHKGGPAASGSALEMHAPFPRGVGHRLKNYQPSCPDLTPFDCRHEERSSATRGVPWTSQKSTQQPSPQVSSVPESQHSSRCSLRRGLPSRDVGHERRLPTPNCALTSLQRVCDSWIMTEFNITQAQQHLGTPEWYAAD